MRVEFRFNGENQVILMPENERDKRLLNLCFSGKEVSLGATKDDTVFIRCIDIPKKDPRKNGGIYAGKDEE